MIVSRLRARRSRTVLPSAPPPDLHRPEKPRAAVPRLLLAVLLAAVLAVPAGGAAAAAADLPLNLLAAAIDAPEVGPAVAVDGPLRVGRATLQVPEHTPVHLLLAAGRPAGLLLGPGTRFEYRVEDRFSIPVAKRNLGEGSPLSGEMDDGALVIAEAAKAVAVWSWQLGAAHAPEPPAASGSSGEGGDEAGGTPAEEPGAGGTGDGAAESAATGEAAAEDASSEAGGDAESGAGAGSGLPEGLRELLATALVAPPSNTLLRDLGIDHDGPGLAYVLVDGGRADLRLTVDPVIDGEEHLASVIDMSRYTTLLRGEKTLHRLAVQPVDREWWERVPAVATAVHEEISVENTEGRWVEVTTRTTVRAERSGVSLWVADLADFTTDGEEILPIEVASVQVDGEPAAWVHHGGELLVALGRTLAGGDTAVVEVSNAGELAIRPNKDSYWYLRTWPWYPQPPLDAEMASLEIEVRSPDPFVPFASGDTVERRRENGVHVLRTRTDKPVQFPVVAAGKYHVFTETFEGTACTVATYAFGKERPAKVLQDLFFSAADTFEAFFGVPYPFAEVSVVEVNSWGWGQAPPGIIFITQEAYNPISDTVSRFYSQGVNARFVHEVAHTWWAHVIKMPTYEEQWLTESFADYAAALAMQAMQEGKRGEREFKTTLREWRANAQDVGAGGSIYLANHLDSADPTDLDNLDRIRLLYNKGPLVLHALRQELQRATGSEETGDKYFQALLRTFTTNFTFQHGETRHLVGILNQMTGRDWQPWFERYVYGTEMPEVEM